MTGQEDGTQHGWRSDVLLTGPPEARVSGANEVRWLGCVVQSVRRATVHGTLGLLPR